MFYLIIFYINLECGISSTKQTAQRRIVGGDDAGFGSFPWQVKTFKLIIYKVYYYIIMLTVFFD